MIPVGRVAKTYGGPDLMESGIMEVNADWDNFRNCTDRISTADHRFRGAAEVRRRSTMANGDAFDPQPT